MKERSKKAPSIEDTLSFDLEPGEVFFGIKRVHVKDSHHAAFTISKLIKKEDGHLERELVYGPNLEEYVLPNLEMLAKEHIETLVL